MRYLAASVHQPPADRNPMHQFVVGHGDYEVSRLLYRDQYADAEHALLFHVGGPRDPYERALARQGSVREFELSSCPDDSFYVYVRAAITGRDREFADAFSQPGLIVITPIEYRADGTVRLTAVGPAETIQKPVEAVPGDDGRRGRGRRRVLRRPAARLAAGSRTHSPGRSRGRQRSTVRSSDTGPARRPTASRHAVRRRSIRRLPAEGLSVLPYPPVRTRGTSGFPRRNEPASSARSAGRGQASRGSATPASSIGVVHTSVT